MRKKFSSRRLKAALIKADGLIMYASKLAGCSYNTIAERIKEEPDLQALFDELQAKIPETCSKTLLNAQNATDKDGYPTMVAVTAADRLLRIHPAAKAAGFGERTELSGDKDNPVKMILEQAGAKIAKND